MDKTMLDNALNTLEESLDKLVEGTTIDWDDVPSKIQTKVGKMERELEMDGGIMSADRKKKLKAEINALLKPYEKKSKKKKEAVVRTDVPMSKPERDQPELDFFDVSYRDTDAFMMFEDMLAGDNYAQSELLTAVAEGYGEGGGEDADVRHAVAEKVRNFIVEINTDATEGDDALLIKSDDEEILDGIGDYLISMGKFLKTGKY